MRFVFDISEFEHAILDKTCDKTWKPSMLRKKSKSADWFQITYNHNCAFPWITPGTSSLFEKPMSNIPVSSFNKFPNNIAFHSITKSFNLYCVKFWKKYYHFLLQEIRGLWKIRFRFSVSFLIKSYHRQRLNTQCMCQQYLQRCPFQRFLCLET